MPKFVAKYESIILRKISIYNNNPTGKLNGLPLVYG